MTRDENNCFKAFDHFVNEILTKGVVSAWIDHLHPQGSRAAARPAALIAAVSGVIGALALVVLNQYPPEAGLSLILATTL